ncbi:related to carboxypeptidase C (cathepsin A) [Rhynchosporium graminicola]|uniref:Related to carboxypeptidase C (Cathepsin A) n=1 Tax=Rhynchosporium graminicola TaxID=2792576 RepID=A0A1E1JQE0_9HELO|nr:related to carboxypeptidase C (cathepsin A) [Rhynchosporium commune]
MLLPILTLLAVPAVLANFPPPLLGVKTLKSKYHEGVTISYKKPDLCETTPGVKSYSGYVHLPPGLLSDINGESQDYPINTFFWFFEARKDPHNAPLSIWLNGGPGSSSLMGLLQENGPCFVGPDSNSTILNPWSWNNEVNMLYLDQPTQVGFSYDVPTNVTVNFAASEADQVIKPFKFTDGNIPADNYTFFTGTMGSQSALSTANSTTHAAHALWHFAQTWFSEFPAYKPNDDKISLWTESYGGHYGPSFFKFFQEQNEKITNGTIKEEGTHYLHLDTLGITYGLELINKTTYENGMDDWFKPGGCKEKMLKCQEQAAELDPDWNGNVDSVNQCFEDLKGRCISIVDAAEATTNWGWFDITHPHADPTPEPYMLGYLTQSWVLEALGVPVNFSSSSSAVFAAFGTTHDIERRGSIEAVSYLLDSGVKVHMVYGDRDYACNWLGGEAASLTIKYSRSDQFKQAGYAPILGSDRIGGFVRQFGNFSFSRVLQAGHEVPWYQPEVSYNIFMRAIFNKDIATGILPVFDELATIGPSSTFHFKNTVPEAPEPRCYILNPDSCTPEQYAGVKDGTAIVRDFFAVDSTRDAANSDPSEEDGQHLFVGFGQDEL